jgi:hypothetical protein
MNDIDKSDLYHYFQVYEEYKVTENASVTLQLDKTLSQYKDRFHKASGTALKLLKEKREEFLNRYEEAYRDLVFDLEVHAETVEDIKRTHTYDAEKDVWVPKGRRR